MGIQEALRTFSAKTNLVTDETLKEFVKPGSTTPKDTRERLARQAAARQTFFNRKSR